MLKVLLNSGLRKNGYLTGKPAVCLPDPGYCSLKTQFFPNGQERQVATPMFWVYYPDLRPILAKYEVYNPKNMGQSRMTWEEFLKAGCSAAILLNQHLIIQLTEQSGVILKIRSLLCWKEIISKKRSSTTSKISGHINH